MRISASGKISTLQILDVVVATAAVVVVVVFVVVVMRMIVMRMIVMIRRSRGGRIRRRKRPRR